MLLSIALILAYITPVVIFIGILICIPYLKKMPLVNKWLFSYLILAFTFDVLGKLLGHFFGTNLALIPLYSFLELILFTKLFATAWLKGKKSILISVLGVIGCGYIIYEGFTINLIELEKFQSYSRAVDAFLIVFFSMIYFFEKLSVGTNPNEESLKLNTVFLVFFSLHLILFLPINFLVNTSLNFKFFFFFISITLALLFYLSLIILIWKHGKTQRH